MQPCRHEWVIAVAERKLVQPYCRKCLTYQDIDRSKEPERKKKRHPNLKPVQP